MMRRVFKAVDGREIYRRSQKGMHVYPPPYLQKDNGEGLPVTDVLPPEVRRGRMGDKCWSRDQSITGSDDEGQKDEKEEREEDGGNGKRKSGVVTLRIEFRIAEAGRFLWGCWTRDILRINDKPEAFLIGNCCWCAKNYNTGMLVAVMINLREKNLCNGNKRMAERKAKTTREV